MQLTYAVVLHKATRKPLIVEAGLALSAAVARANALYEESKLLSKHATLASGVSVLVIDEARLVKNAEGDLMSCGFNDAMHQCGCW